MMAKIKYHSSNYYYFQLHFGPNLWDTVRLVDGLSTRKELIHYVPVMQNYIHVCLVNTDSGVPFISVLELRPLPNSTYPEQKNNSLALVTRCDIGAMRHTGESVIHRRSINILIDSPCPSFSFWGHT